MNAQHRSGGVTLLAASHSDAVIAQDVASALRHRRGGGVKVICEPAGRLSACDALVTAKPPEELADFLLTRRGTRQLPASALLIHPDPDARLYATALRGGLADVLAWPAERERVCELIVGGAAVKTAAGAQVLQPSPLCGESPRIRELRRRIERVAAFDSTVLIQGETGSGKECVARAIHAGSRRAAQAMVSLNCAALPENLIEAELFGHERGAYTGAHASAAGKFELADGGTLFLDEIGEMSKAAQAKVLRVIEGQEFYRIGGTRPQRVDVRLIAATHRNLEQLCASGEFRSDLYFRLNVAPVQVPALRERSGDVPLLAEYFVAEISRLMQRPKPQLGEDARAVLCAHDWPGNVRELRNAIESALINCEGGQLRAHDLPTQLMRWRQSQVSGLDELRCLESALRRCGWNKSEAARALQWSRMKLYRKLRVYESQLGTQHET
ncbi:regulatory protein, Fis family [Solimonas aquatica]|uniref:Regulatory protein, Fis family n=1 Tax=Solimonas aquatica TaxID=489703 RepID=A0A1H8ZID3_9GAMM|nr:sigma 54-interacting transcriptional regulator [Solimonas aquatica]SEP64299.1 regulatory protein, Fis family [Solimonas aquatica]